MKLLFLLLYLTQVSKAEDLLSPRHSTSTKPTNTATTKDLVKIGDEWIEKTNAVRVLDIRNFKYGDPEKYGDDLSEVPPLKFKNRIYARFHKEENRWLPDLARKHGYFSTPDRFILPGSVVPGEWLGVPGVRYEFLKNKPNFEAWVVTDKRVNVLWSVLTGRTETGQPIRETRVINPD